MYVFITLVQSTGAAKIMESPQTTISDLLQLVMVHKDLDFIGKTITINLKVWIIFTNLRNKFYWAHIYLSVVTAKRFSMEATPDKTREYSAILHDPELTNS